MIYLVNNAGVAHVGNAESTSEEDFTRLFNVNVKGVYNLLHAVIPFMKEKGGAILNMASVASSVGIPDRFAYSMTKGAVVGMTLSTAKDYINYKIRCNCISPGKGAYTFCRWVYCKKLSREKKKRCLRNYRKHNPLAVWRNLMKLLYLVLYLCSDEASFITGCDYPIDGGFIKLNTLGLPNPSKEGLTWHRPISSIIL